MGIVFWGSLLLLVNLALIVLVHLYLVGSFRKLEDYDLTGLPASAPSFPETIASMSDSLVTEGAIARFWSDIDTIQLMRLKLMSQARQLIQFETFIMTPGERTEAFAVLLKQKAAEGVTVQVLVDSYGAHTLPKTYWQELENAGVQVCFFNPFTIRDPVGYLRRNHRKLLIVDQQVAMIGGAGMADRWDGKDDHPGRIPWYDFEIELRGAAVGLLTGFFWQHWLSSGGHVDLREHHPEDADVTNPGPILITPGEDPSTGDSPIRSLLHLCITAAQTRLWIASPYLLPDRATRKALAAMRQRGVDVRILTMGPKSDKFYVYCTSRERYEPLLQQGIKIHEYQPSMMHGKILLVDDQWVSLGSANLDPRSFFHNDELNVCVSDRGLTQQVEDFFLQGFSNSELVQFQSWQRRPIKERLIGHLANLVYWQL
ncbi:MAG: phospholipase D-like domain-containing protein, partial [Cyanobacteria bacterium J06636_16]